MLRALFESCLGADYQKTVIGGSWAHERSGDALFLYFEHSNGVLDWLHNLQFTATPYRDMQPNWECHTGFLRVWKSVRPHLEPLIADPTVREITIVGYSHGAALAVLCHEWVWFHRPDLRERLSGFGFGCPRVLFGCVPPALALRWDRFFVVRNLDDLVTHLPPRSLGFCHVGNLITVGAPDRYTPIDAHRPESYLAELQ